MYLEKAEEPEIKLPTSIGSSQKQENSRKIYISALLTMPKPLTVCITTNHGKFLKRWESKTCLLRNLYAGQEATVKTGHETSVQFSRSVMSSSLRPQGLKHARLLCPSPIPGACSNSCPSNYLILCHPLLLLPSIFPSIRVFPNKSLLRIRWPKHWSFSFNISPSNEYSGLMSFRMDRFDLLVVQGTLKSLLQHHSSKASILRHSVFFIVQLSHPYMTTGKNHSIDYTDLCWQSDVSAF